MTCPSRTALGALLFSAFLLTGVDASADRPLPVRLAVFDFELEDFSGGADLVGQTPDDAVQLDAATREVRRLLEQSGRYVLVDTGSPDAEAARQHSLHQCNGCDAGIALKLGADQSLVGVIGRISRTEYTVQIRIRDSRTGAVAFEKQSDLRMGANYSWGRGASSLIRNDLLADRDR